MSDILRRMREMGQQTTETPREMSNPVPTVPYAPPNLKAQLTRRLEDAQQRVDDITAAVVLLEKNPDIEQLLSLLGRTGL